MTRPVTWHVLTDALCVEFGRHAVLHGFDSIRPGHDFTKANQRIIGFACHTFVVVIGRNWLNDIRRRAASA